VFILSHFCEISCYHGGEHEGEGLLEYTPVQSGIAFIIRVTMMMMEAIRISETSVYSETTRRYVPEGSHIYNIYLIFSPRMDLKIKFLYVDLGCFH
jgi:hypothetical protein